MAFDRPTLLKKHQTERSHEFETRAKYQDIWDFKALFLLVADEVRERWFGPGHTLPVEVCRGRYYPESVIQDVAQAFRDDGWTVVAEQAGGLSWILTLS